MSQITTREEAASRIREIEHRIESATGWGSWMVMAVNEAEDIAIRFKLPFKYPARCNGQRTN